MFIELIKTGKNKQNVYVRLVEAYRNEEGKVRKKIIKNFGRLSDLEKDDPNALNKLKSQYNADKKRQDQIYAENNIQKFRDSITDLNNMAENDTEIPMLDYGHFPLRKLWNTVLGLDKYIRGLSSARVKTYDVNTLLQYFIFHKLIYPCSIIGAYSDRDNFLGDPLRNIKLDQCYDMYTWLYENHDKLFSFINRKIDNEYGTDRATLIFYDVTNTYFETQMTDSEKENVRSDFADVIKNKIDIMKEEGRINDDCFGKDGEIIIDNLPSWVYEELDKDKLVYFRMRGPSKEHRSDLPLVSIALVIDKNGFPMDVVTYSGNTSEFKSMKSSIEALKRKYSIKDAIFVADRGLNSLSNLSMLLESNFGFLVAQKITQFNSSLKSLMLDKSRYTLFEPTNPESGLYQIIQNWEKTGVGGKKITCTLMLTYDEKRKRRDEAILNMWVEIVKAKQTAGVKISPRKTAWAALALTDGDTDQEILGVNDKEYERRKKLCGFAALVFKEPPNINNSQSEFTNGYHLFGTYKRLNQIEDCFRILKSHLGLRPMFVRTAQHIKSHIDICVLALIFMKIIQSRLEKENLHLSTIDIINALRGMHIGVFRDKNNYIYLPISPRITIRKGRESMETNELISLSKNNNFFGNHHKTIMKICGLKPIPRACSRGLLANCLGTVFHNDDDIVPEYVAAHL